MKRILFIIMLVLFGAFAGIAQTKCTIQKAWAFLQTSLPGTIMADENGKQMPPRLNISRSLYIEVKGKQKPVIENVKYGKENCKVALSQVQSLPEDVGSGKTSNKRIRLQPAPGNSLWRLELQAAEEQQVSKTATPYSVVVITERKNGRRINITTQEIELTSPLTM